MCPESERTDPDPNGVCYDSRFLNRPADWYDGGPYLKFWHITGTGAERAGRFTCGEPLPALQVDPQFLSDLEYAVKILHIPRSVVLRRIFAIGFEQIASEIVAQDDARRAK